MIYNNLINIKKKYKAGYFVLIDPDIKNEDIIINLVSKINDSNVDGILIGGSLIMDNGFNERARKIKNTDVTFLKFIAQLTDSGR